MSTPVLVTRLYIPPARPGVIPRRRLIERLNDGLHRKLTLISAHAGFGKTTLVSEWVAGCELPAAWLTLDESDHDLPRFLTYLITALQTVAPGIGEGLVGALQLPQHPPAESVLTALLNEISARPGRIILVLDDYHLVDATPVDDALAFLIEHLPPQVHLVITTREDPRFPLARLRARGEMTELRATDLRFTSDETAAFLNVVMGLDLSPTDVEILESRTEGWIAGLQLAALSMQGRDDLQAFIQGFAGDDRYIVDYLVEEVLRRRPGHIRSFLLQTCILDRLSGSLCDAVTGRDDSRRILESLERGNLFVMPLDHRRHWYRYHHLFADVLQTFAIEEQEIQITERHRLASDWYEQQGLAAEAVRHALAAGEVERAARLVEMAALPMLGSSEEEMLYGWLQALPDDLVRTMPVLNVYYGFASFSREGLDAAEARFRDAERWLDPASDPNGHRDDRSTGMIVADEAAFRSLPGTIAVARAYRAGGLGDVAGMVMSARRALDVLPESDDLWRGAASAVLGIGYWASGQLEPAYRSFAEGKARLEKAGYTQFQIVSVHILADIRVAQGRLRDAERIYEESLRLAAEQGDPAWGTTDLYVGLSELLRERNDLEAATRSLLKSREAGEHAGLLDTRHRWYVAMAGVREARGEFEDALDLLDEAERQYVPGADPVLRPIDALKAQVWVAQGKLEDALEWARERNLSVDDDLGYLREFEHITLARLLIARYRRERDDRSIHEVSQFLHRLLEAAVDGERTGSVIGILVLQALAHEARDDIASALVPLERALSLAEPEGYARIFVGEGAPMARLLSEALRRGIMPEYAGRLLAARDVDVPPVERAAPPAPGPAQPLVEPLSGRELEVLHLIAQGLSNREIGERLFLAVSTVKGHNREIFDKLQVQRRTEAVARARELGIL